MSAAGPEKPKLSGQAFRLGRWHCSGIFTFVGPGRVWIVARTNIDDDLSSGQVKALVRGIESGMKQEAKDIYRVDVVPIDEAQPASS